MLAKQIWPFVTIVKNMLARKRPPKPKPIDSVTSQWPVENESRIETNLCQ